MQTSSQVLIDLENRFWQSMVDQDTDAALSMLTEPALMISAHGAMKFDHAGYRKMAEQGAMVLTKFELRDMDVVFPNDATAILTYRVLQEMAARGSSKRGSAEGGSAKGTAREMADSSTWVRGEDGWRCVMHTETPLESAARASTSTA